MGQFIDHDLSITPEEEVNTVSPFDFSSIIWLTIVLQVDGCCDCFMQHHPNCLPINVQSHDPFYGPFQQAIIVKIEAQLQCLNFVYTLQKCLDVSRSVAYCEGNSPQREQPNEITAFIDASNVYGSDDETAKNLRTLSDVWTALTSGINIQIDTLLTFTMLYPGSSQDRRGRSLAHWWYVRGEVRWGHQSKREPGTRQHPHHIC